MAKLPPTEGEWKWYWRKEGGLAIGSVFAEPREGHAYAVAICPQYQTREQWEIDAPILAASKIMLAALNAVMGEWREGYGLNCVEQVRAAIAAAERVE